MTVFIYVVALNELIAYPSAEGKVYDGFVFPSEEGECLWFVSEAHFFVRHPLGDGVRVCCVTLDLVGFDCSLVSVPPPVVGIEFS